MLELRAVADHALREGCGVTCPYKHRVFTPPNLTILQCALCVESQQIKGYMLVESNDVLSATTGATMALHLGTHHFQDVVVRVHIWVLALR